MEYEGKVLVDADNTEFLIIETVEINGKTYAYIVDKKDETNTRFVELYDDGYSVVNSEILLNTVMPEFAKQIKEEGTN